MARTNPTPEPADTPSVEDFKHPMSETGAVTEDKPVGRLVPQPATVADPVLPKPPSFKISEGTRAELAEHGTAICPFTGRTLKAEDYGVERTNKREEDTTGVSANASGLQ